MGVFALSILGYGILTLKNATAPTMNRAIRTIRLSPACTEPCRPLEERDYS